ncbi:MAG: cytochrome c biogenesis protein ResB [Pseudomonadota bacterium]
MSDKQTTPAGGERIWNFFASVKLSFSLLLALAITSVLGTLIPQKEDLSVYIQAYGESGTRLVQALRLNDMYHAPWFLLLLACLALNLVICSLNRLPTSLKLMAKDPQAELKRGGAAEVSFSLSGPPARHLERVTGLLRAAVGPVTAGQVDQKQVLFAQKGAWSRLGVYLVHLSVIVIMVGAIVGNIWGFSGRLNLNEGQTSDHIDLDNGQTRELGFSLRLEKFQASFYKDGMPSEYRSDVTFLEKGQPAMQAVLKVNDPADFHGVDFYQASYGQSVSLLEVEYVHDGKRQKVALPHGTWVDLEGGAKALLLEARPQIRMGDMYQGPAARIGYQIPGSEPLAITAFKAGAPFPARGPASFEILDMQSVPYSGFSVKYDPGVWFIWVGCGLMVVGFYVTFYRAHRKVWVRLIPAGQNRAKVEIMGSTNKNRLGLKRILERLGAKIKSDPGLGTGGDAA